MNRSPPTVVRGRSGEDRAVEYLQKKGHRILARNFRTRYGEVDIVSVANGVLIFAEVKSWRRFDPDFVQRALGPQKQRRIIATAQAFRTAHMFTEERVRFDVLLVEQREGGSINHLEGAFEASWLV